MRRFLRYAAPVFIVLFIPIGCSTTPKPDAPAEVSLERKSPKPPKSLALADPGYVIYDLSRLRIGMTMSEVYNLFSKPNVIKHAPKDEYWEYDWFELFFREGRLVEWFNLPERRQKVMPSSQSSQAGRRGAFGGL